jgi:serine/threonine-protein kinase
MQHPVISPYPPPGEVLDGKYRIERMLGEGGMGAVAKATHLVRRAPVALKFMSPAIIAFPSAVERFVNEGVAASQIDSDHVVKVFDVGRLPSGAPYLVMEFLDGRDLGQLLAAEGPVFDVARAVYFTLQILRALQTAHAAGIVHRDMKPSNCFVIEKDGERDFVKLVDFGISKVRTADDASGTPNLTRTNSALGTPLYMSPEQARSPRDVDHRTDLYSVGAILYEMLCGRTPYTSESGEYTEILFKIFTTEPEPLRVISPSVPEGLADVVHRALSRDRELRFAGAAEMADALAPFADGRSAEILTRIRNVRGRSLVPASGTSVRSVVPIASEARARPEEAEAGHTYASSEALRAPRVPTDVGVTRESTTAHPPVGHRGAVVAALGAAAVLATAAAAFFALRARDANVVSSSMSQAPAPIVAPQQTVARAPGPAASPLAAPLPAPSVSVDLAPVTLPPAPSASAAPTAQASASVAPAALKPSARPVDSSAPNGLPKQLSDVKFH